MAVNKKKREEKQRGHGVRSLAILGDSGISLVASSVLLIVAVTFRYYSSSAIERFSTYQSLGPLPTIAPPVIYNLSANADNMLLISDAIRQEYERDGVVCIRGLINQDLLERLNEESSTLLKSASGHRRKGKQFHTEEHSALFRSGMRDTESPSAFMAVAMLSNVSRVAAELLLRPSVPQEQQEVTTSTLRVVRDIFLARDDDEFVCGWHVDDLGFWPATPDSPGINAWIALDDMESIEDAGGFAMAVQSDRAPWKAAAQFATGASTSFPKEGYKSAHDMMEKRTGSGTCNLRYAAPHINQRMEETARIYPVKRGDVVFHTRWLFHRTVAASSRSDKVYRRYSVRYGPGSQTIVPPAYGTELSVLWNPANGGSSLDEVAANDGPWYPQAWPHLKGAHFSQFWKDFLSLREEKFPVANERRKSRVKELKRESQQRHRQKQRNFVERKD